MHPQNVEPSRNLGQSQISLSGKSIKSTTKSTEGLVDEEVPKDYLCGIGSYRPDCLQQYANPRWFFCAYTIMGILQGAYKTYLVGTLSTIERRFQMSNSTTAFILIADNISPIVINIIVGYYANRISRPKLMSIGTMIVVGSCICSLMPFLIYGPGYRAEDSTMARIHEKMQLCHNASDATSLPRGCSSEAGNNSMIPFLLLLFANFLNGSGGSVFFVVGSTYMDDNIKKKNSPMYFSFAFAFRLFGPVLGFMTASVCLKFNEDFLNGTPSGLDPTSDEWIGAWWLGYIIFSIGLTAIAIPMMFFPRILPSGKNHLANKAPREATDKGAAKDIMSAVMRLSKNPVFTLKSVGVVFSIIATAGYGTTFTKYMEHQFGQTASKASFLSGTSKVLTNMIGLMAGGILIQKLKPKPRSIAGYIAFVELIFIGGYIWLMFVGCHNSRITGLATSDQHEGRNTPKITLTNQCNRGCACYTTDFKPVCAPDGTTLFSPCHAGCKSVSKKNNGTSISYEDCTCGGNSTLLSKDVSSTSDPLSVFSVVPGFCGPACTAMMLYLTIIVVCQLIGSTARVGSMLLYLRCVSAEDKSMALGTTSSFINLVAFIPYPLIYGRILDNSCILWSETCNGGRGSCKLYDIDKLRYTMHLVTVGFLSIALVCYVAVVFYAQRIKNFYDEEGDESPKENGVHNGNACSEKSKDTTL